MFMLELTEGTKWSFHPLPIRPVSLPRRSASITIYRSTMWSMCGPSTARRTGPNLQPRSATPIKRGKLITKNRMLQPSRPTDTRVPVKAAESRMEKVRRCEKRMWCKVQGADSTSPIHSHPHFGQWTTSDNIPALRGSNLDGYQGMRFRQPVQPFQFQVPDEVGTHSLRPVHHIKYHCKIPSFYKELSTKWWEWCACVGGITSPITHLIFSVHLPNLLFYSVYYKYIYVFRFIYIVFRKYMHTTSASFFGGIASPAARFHPVQRPNA